MATVTPARSRIQPPPRPRTFGRASETATPDAPPEEVTGPSDDEAVEQAVQRWRLFVGASLFALLAVVALVLGRVLLGPEEALFGAFVFLFYLMFAGLPFWIPILIVEGDDARKRFLEEAARRADESEARRPA